MALTINQNGLSLGSLDKSRSDGLANGALISVTSSVSTSLTLRWKPDDDNTSSLIAVNGTHWTISPKANVYGTYMFHDSVNDVKRVFAIRTPNKGLRIPALNETANNAASLTNNSLSIIGQSDFNEASGSGPFSIGNYGGWYSAIRELILAVDSVTGTMGPIGAQGPSGSAGVAGASGSAGPQGPSGSQWTTGAGAPNNSSGLNGDWYLNTLNYGLYNKSGGVYTQVLTLTGSVLPASTTDAKFPYLTIPTGSAFDSWNLEPTLMTDPNLANNGWIVTLQNTSNTILSRSGDVQFNTSTPTAGTYRSTLVNGQLWMQAPAAIVIAKATTSTGSSYTYKSRVWTSFYGSGNYSLSFVSTNGYLWSNTGTTFYYVGIEDANVDEVIFTGPSTVSTPINTTATLETSDTVRYINSAPWTGSNQKVSTKSYTSLHGQFSNPSDTGDHDLGAPLTHAGVIVKQSTSQLIYIDFIRRLASGSFP